MGSGGNLEFAPQLCLEIGAEPALEPALELTHALARDAKARRQRRQLDRLVIEQALPEDLDLSSLQRRSERLQLGAEDLG